MAHQWYHGLANVVRFLKIVTKVAAYGSVVMGITTSIVSLVVAAMMITAIDIAAAMVVESINQKVAEEAEILDADDEGYGSLEDAQEVGLEGKHGYSFEAFNIIVTD